MRVIDLKLFQAIEESNVEVVTNACSAGANIEALDTRSIDIDTKKISAKQISFYNRPLHVAINRFRRADPENINALKIVEFLIAKGADKKAIGADGQRLNVQKSSKLLELPDEIILMIQENFDVATLSSYSQACTKLSRLARDPLTVRQNIMNDKYAKHLLGSYLRGLPGSSHVSADESLRLRESVNELPRGSMYSTAIFLGQAGREFDEDLLASIRHDTTSHVVCLSGVLVFYVGLFLLFVSIAFTEKPLFFISSAMCLTGFGGCCFFPPCYDAHRFASTNEALQEAGQELLETVATILAPGLNTADEDVELESNNIDEEEGQAPTSSLTLI